MKQPSEYQRLSRAFGIRKHSKRLPIIMGSGAALMGLATWFGFAIAGGVVVGMGGGAIGNRTRVRRGLRELERWGFPVEGYRTWLLADEPTFEIELARMLDLDVLVTSVRAIDPSIRVIRTRERTFQLITRRIALPPQRGDTAPILVGDRELLQQLHERLLSPLHADVGIRRMQMGDRERMPAPPPLLPAGDSGGGGDTGEGTSMGAFRDQALAAPPALQALVYAGGDRELPREARTVKNRAMRVVYATGSAPHGVGTVVGFTLAGLTTGAGWVGPIGLAIGAVAGGIGGAVAAVKGNKRNARKIAASVHGHGFPIEGYDDWLISGRPIFDLELEMAIDPSTLTTMLESLPRAWSIGANAEVSWVVEVMWLDAKLVRIESRPTLVEPPSRIEPFYGGSHAMFETFRAQVLAPLHQHVGIASVQMGGYLSRRV